MKNRLSDIVVVFITHGAYAGSQSHKTEGEDKYTLYTRDGLERKLMPISYFRVLNEIKETT